VAAKPQLLPKRHISWKSCVGCILIFLKNTNASTGTSKRAQAVKKHKRAQAVKKRKRVQAN